MSRPIAHADRRGWARTIAGEVLVAGCAAAGRPGGQAPTAGTAGVNGTSLYYETRGSGTTVVLLQGGNLGLGMWDDQFAELARSHRVIRYDVRSFGRSAPATAPYTHHDDLHALLRHLGVARASLVGLSLGGRIAVDFTLEHPEMVESLVLAGPGLSGWRRSGTDTLWLPRVRAASAVRDSVRMALAWLGSDLPKWNYTITPQSA